MVDLVGQREISLPRFVRLSLHRRSKSFLMLSWYLLLKDHGTHIRQSTSGELVIEGPCVQTPKICYSKAMMFWTSTDFIVEGLCLANTIARQLPSYGS